MKTIQALIPPRRPGGRTTVCFSDRTTCRLIPSVVEDRGLYPGMELDEAALDSLRTANGEASAKQRAVRIISVTGVTQGDLKQRLIRKGESPDDAETAVAWLSELKLLDDAETARQIVARGVSRGYGAKRIQQMLYEKRVPRKYWEEALASIPDQSGELRDFLAARLGEAPDEKQRKRAIDAALRRGFTWSEVQAALRRLGADEPE